MIADAGANDAVHNRRKWFFKNYDALAALVCEDYSVLDLETALFRVAAALPKCRAANERQFREWARNQVRKLADEKRLFEYGANLTLQDVLTLAAAQPVRKGTKPLEYEQHGDKVFIKLQDSRGRVLPWVIPTEWLPIARAVWPVHVRRCRTGLYVSKKVPQQRLSGTWGQRDLPIHHLFLNCNSGDAVEARNGNFLDWSGGNLHVKDASPETKLSKEVSLESQPDAFIGWKPSKPTQIPRSRDRITNRPYTNEHERKVWAWLQGI